MAGATIDARGLGVTFAGGTVALAGLDLGIRPGEFVALVGPSGCGKSTLLRTVAGLQPPSAGTLTVDGEDPARPARRGPPVAFVFQDPTLLPWRSALANARLPLDLARVPRPEADRRARAALARVGLHDFADAHPAELSGGMRMRASLARALVERPALLLLDEPFGALDERSRVALNHVLVDLWREGGFTALMVTHSLLEAVAIATRVLVLAPRPGRVVADLPVDLPHPRSLTGPGQRPLLDHLARVEAALGEPVA